MTDFEEFWETEGRERITWFEPFEQLYEWKLPYAKWYLGGKLNVCFNCVDRHVEAGEGDRVAFYWEGEPEGDRREISYAQLQRDVVRFANVLSKIGVRRGTPVAIYMGMVPELPVAMLACTRLGGSAHGGFGGFSADSLSGRMNDMGCEVLITQDAGWRKGSEVPLKKTAYAAMADAPTVKRCVVVRRKDADVEMVEDRDVWYHELAEGVTDTPSRARASRWTPKTCSSSCRRVGRRRSRRESSIRPAGYLVGVATTHHYIFDLMPERDAYWCAADIGWITGHSYIVYGPLANGATSVVYEGKPDFPDKIAGGTSPSATASPSCTRRRPPSVRT
jgi:acetyl-CoA synthetase